MLYRHTFYPRMDNVTPFILKGVGRGTHYGLPLNNVHPLFTIRVISPIFSATTEIFSKHRKKPNNTLPDSEIKPETPCSAVALAITRLTSQSG
ncbi:hypothetical protein SFRURICE_000891 [Spodoptera frugiperda]|nr:hypothetical protein SFRURICE_000891 [Spodoptera frugiperda]